MYRFRGLGGLVGGVIVGGGVAKLRAEHEALCDGAETNSAFVFVKPHANTTATQNLVKSTLQVCRPSLSWAVDGGLTVPWLTFARTCSPFATTQAKGIKITAEGELTGPQIDKDMLIDQHYYAIASKATLLKPKDMPVPAAKFEEAFGLPWAKALADGLVFNALDACKELGVDAQVRARCTVRLTPCLRVSCGACVRVLCAWLH
jgi:hypothetical protein